MSVDQAIDNDRDVRVGVDRGNGTSGIGALVFDRDIEFTDPPRLGVCQPPTHEPEGSDGSVPIALGRRIQCSSTRSRMPRKSTSSFGPCAPNMDGFAGCSGARPRPRTLRRSLRPRPAQG